MQPKNVIDFVAFDVKNETLLTDFILLRSKQIYGICGFIFSNHIYIF